MRTPFPYATLALLCAALSGCAATPAHTRTPMMLTEHSIDRAQQRSELMQKLMSDPDIPPWYNQRERVIEAMGDRVFDKSFDRVFDSVTVALATLGANVRNMERQSGYITSAVPTLGPERERQLRMQAAREWCRYNKYDATLLEKDKDERMHIDVVGMGNFSRHTQAITISMVRQGKEQTKVKVRFADIYYPGMLQDHYKTLWAAIDKQIFLDRGLD